jgi:DNA-binding transcriptional ArsR family regulator
VLKVIEENAGISAGKIRTAVDLTHDRARRAVAQLRDEGLIEMRGERGGARYHAKGAADRPKDAPEPQRRAVPARKSHAHRNTKAKAAHNALRKRIAEAYVKVLAEGPMGKTRVAAKVLELVPETTLDEIGRVRGKLLGDRVLEVRANKLQLSGVDTSKPITSVEREVVASLGSGRTAKEVAANCKLVRDAFSARTILAALVSRGVIAQRPESSPPVYEQLVDLEAVA